MLRFLGWLPLVLLLDSRGSSPELEVKFWPGDQVYARTVAQPWLHDFVLQNVAIINRTGEPVTLERIEIAVRSQGKVVQQRSLSLAQLGPNLRSFQTKYENGDLKVWEQEYRLAELFKDARLVATAKLGAGEGISVRDQYFAWNDQGDTVEVGAIGTAASGATVRGAGRLPLVRYQSRTALSLPLKGIWQVANGPYPTVSHRWVIHQEFGYDLWKIDSTGSDHAGDGTRFEQYYAYGQDLVAPADGVVRQLRADAEDSPLISDRIIKDQGEFFKRLIAQRDLLLQQGYLALGGNYLIIDHGNGEYSHFAHLKKGSLRVSPGDRVTRGQFLAQVGNTGLSNVPHLHYELVAAPDLPNRRGLPLRFVGINGDTTARELNLEEFVRNGWADKTSPQPASEASARPGDVSSADAIVTALYDVISGPAGQKREWDRFRSLFAPGARLIPTGRRQDGSHLLRVLTPEDYITSSAPLLENNGFFEREISQTSESFGGMVHRFSSYESRRAATESTPFARGINSIQLVSDGQRWWILTVLGDSERPGNPIPARYLRRP